VHELMAEAACEEGGFRPGMVAVVHTAGDFLGWHPHAHALVSRGGWIRGGDWIPVPYIDMRAAELLFRRKIFLMLKKEGLLSDERIKLMLSWRHSGFSVDSSVRVDAGDTKALERVARYILRPPVSLERLSWNEAAGEVSYRAKSAGVGHTQSERFDPLDFLARVIMHVPEPKLHTARFYGAYSSVARGKRRAEKAEQLSPEPDGGTEEPSSEERRRMRRSWAQSIKRVYELNPLTCPDCGAEMRVISFILDPKVIDKILNHLSKNGIEPGRGPPDPAVEPAKPPS